MLLNDLLKDWFKDKVDGNVELIKVNECQNETSDFIVRSTYKAVLLNTSGGEIWVPLSALKINSSWGTVKYIDYKYLSTYQEITIDEQVIFSVELNRNYMEVL